MPAHVSIIAHLAKRAQWGEAARAIRQADNADADSLALVEAFYALNEGLEQANAECAAVRERLARAEAEASALLKAIGEARMHISGGLTYFSAAAKHAQLSDAEKALAAGAEAVMQNKGAPC